MTGHFVHPFDDDRFISGNGTIGLEILEDLPDVDAVIAPIGGGGLLAGIAAALRRPAPADPASLPRSRKRPRRWPPRSRPDARCNFRLDSLVRRRRRRQVGAADDVAAVSELVDGSIVVSLDEVATRDARWSPSASTSSRKAPPRAPSPPRSPDAPAAARLSRSSRAATSTCRSSRRSSEPATDLDATHLPHHAPNCDPSDARADGNVTTPPLPDGSPTPRARARLSGGAGTVQARDVFRRLDYPLWRRTAHNPVLMLRMISASTLDAGGRRSRTSWRSTIAAIAGLDARASARRHLVARARSRTLPRDRSPISRPSSRCTSRCPSTPAASACSPAITARKRATSAFR